MIQINSFIPTSNFSRRVWEFHEDKIVVRTKSLMVDVENEIKYERIKNISTKKKADLSWLLMTFIIFGILGFTTLVLVYFGLSNPTTNLIRKAVAIFALLLMIPVFHKSEFYVFFDAEKYFLADIKIDNEKKRALITEAINLIKQKTGMITEIYLSNPLPSISPIFEVVEFDFPDYLNQSITRFYEDRIIEIHKSLVEETARVTKYNELSGKTKIVRAGNDNWLNVWFFWFMFVGVAGFSAVLFFPKQIGGNPLVFNLIFGSAALLIPMFFLRYIKREFLVFNDQNNEGVLGIGINNKNRERLNQIVEFVKGKVESKR